MKDLYFAMTLTGSAALAVVIPWFIYKACKAVCLKRNYEDLQSKVVVITGASGGLGEALAREYYKRGSLVVLCARRKDELERVKTDLKNNVKTKTPAPDPIVIPLDLSDIASLPERVKTVLSLTGRIDILVNNGGLSTRGTVLETNTEVHMNVMTVNYFGSLALTKAVLPHLVKNKSGQIVFIGSVQSLISIPERSAYGASKHALRAFADSLRAEVAKHNIMVSSIYPGYINTDISKNALTGSGSVHGQMDETTANGYSPEYAAEATVRAVAEKRKEFILSPLLPRMAIFLRNFAPCAYFYVMAKRAKSS